MRRFILTLVAAATLLSAVAQPAKRVPIGAVVQHRSAHNHHPKGQNPDQQFQDFISFLHSIPSLTQSEEQSSQGTGSH